MTPLCFAVIQRGMKTEKHCFKCHEIKPLTEFYAHKMMGDGHLNKCKSCTKADVKARYYKDFHKIRAYEAKRFKTPERKAKTKLYLKTLRAKYPHKTKARAAVARALRKGTLARLPCEMCGDNKTQAHHHDYYKPLDVKWLCFKCHRLEHGQTNVLIPPP